mmetsp:Transcript_54644/g.132705  ORF Transcript_54644/g.132705 Transcript_54644/m.132705 type:complete len:110 (-) Transcript_54644:2142-2471(-)
MCLTLYINPRQCCSEDSHTIPSIFRKWRCESLAPNTIVLSTGFCLGGDQISPSIIYRRHKVGVGNPSSVFFFSLVVVVVDKIKTSPDVVQTTTYLPSSSIQSGGVLIDD